MPGGSHLVEAFGARSLLLDAEEEQREAQVPRSGAPELLVGPARARRIGSDLEEAVVWDSFENSSLRFLYIYMKLYRQIARSMDR